MTKADAALAKAPKDAALKQAVKDAKAAHKTAASATKTADKARAPKLKAADKAGFKYEKLMAGDNVELALNYGVKQAPTLVITDGESFEKFAGAGAIFGTW